MAAEAPGEEQWATSTKCAYGSTMGLALLAALSAYCIAMGMYTWLRPRDRGLAWPAAHRSVPWPVMLRLNTIFTGLSSRLLRPYV